MGDSAIRVDDMGATAIDEDEVAVEDPSLPPPRRAWIAVFLALLSPISAFLYTGTPRLTLPFIAIQVLLAIWLVAGWTASFAGFFAYFAIFIGQGLIGMAVAGFVAARQPRPIHLARYQRYWIYLAVIIAIGAGQRVAASVDGPAVVGVESSSMFPTLWSSDLVLATGGELNNYEPRRGDIVVYWHPQQPGERWIKRIVAVSGDYLTIDDGQLIVNGEPVERVDTDPYIWEPRPGLRLTFKRAVETWPTGLDPEERTVETVHTGSLTGNYHNEDNLRIVGDNVYVMGDYRDNSLDSRAQFHGLLPIKNITHRVVGILYSPRRELTMVPVYSQTVTIPDAETAE
ncbi:MAG: signal peptidase I [Alphaproteobacteria bacterium]|nr:signal peptidase I [Alphaproteobacteria bacterium SS10]